MKPRAVSIEAARAFTREAHPEIRRAGVTSGVARWGDNPRAVSADTVQATVKIAAIDTTSRRVTFRTKDGDLETVKVGDSVTIRRTVAMEYFILRTDFGQSHLRWRTR